MSLNTRRLLTAIAFLLAFSLVADRKANAEIRDADFYGSDERLVRKLSTLLSVRWDRVPLGEVLERLERTMEVSIWLDRRSDPNVLVSFDAVEMPLGEMIEQLASRSGLGFSASRGLVYLGPPETALELRTHWALAHKKVEAMAPNLRATMRKRSSLSIARLSKPRETIAQLGKRMKVPIENLDEIPYDLRPAAELPSMAAIEQWTLLLLEFDRSWKPSRDGRSVRLVPIARPVEIEREHPKRSKERMSSSTFRELYPEARVRAADNRGKIFVTGLVEQHEWLRGKKRPRETKPQRHQRPGKQVYSLRVDEKPAGAILKQLAAQLNRQLSFDEDAAEIKTAFQKRITFEVREATLEELLETVGKQIDLEVRVRGETIEVSSE